MALTLTSEYLQKGGRRKSSTHTPRSLFDAYLTEHGLTYAEVARRLGVSREIVRLWALGKTVPFPERMVEIAQVLDVPPATVRRWFAGVPAKKRRGPYERDASARPPE